MTRYKHLVKRFDQKHYDELVADNFPVIGSIIMVPTDNLRVVVLTDYNKSLSRVQGIDIMNMPDIVFEVFIQKFRNIVNDPVALLRFLKTYELAIKASKANLFVNINTRKHTCKHIPSDEFLKMIGR